MTAPFEIRAINESDRPWVKRLLQEQWGSERIVTRGRLTSADQLPGFVALVDRDAVGLITYEIREGECEIVSLGSMKEGIGVGSALLAAVRTLARSAGCARVWLITTNDNLHALGFYQKRGMHLAALYADALKRSRELKPEFPEIGLEGIPLRDEIELEYILA